MVRPEPEYAVLHMLSNSYSTQDVQHSKRFRGLAANLAAVAMAAPAATCHAQPLSNVQAGHFEGGGAADPPVTAWLAISEAGVLV